MNESFKGWFGKVDVRWCILLMNDVISELNHMVLHVFNRQTAEPYDYSPDIHRVLDWTWKQMQLC